MLIEYFFRNKILTNRRFVSVLLPYFIFCLTMGGFHDGICKDKHCDYTQQFLSDNTNEIQIGILDDLLRHDSEICQVCQWLKDSSTLARFPLLDTYFDRICSSLVYYFNSGIPFLSIHKFTIRPPPQNV